VAKETALLIVDVQEGMFRIEPPVHRGKELLETIRELLVRARKAGAPVIYVQHDGEEPEHPLRPSGPGWPIHSAVTPLPGEPVIRKKHSDSFQGTRLQEDLAARGIRRVVVSGIQSDYCVDTTCRRAFSLGYEVILAADAHSTWDDSACSAAQIIAHHNEVLSNGFATVQPAREVNCEAENQRRSS
jgi:nicotinamidase-related amidase